jgi:ParB/RepB/Spo0J family partition protein
MSQKIALNQIVVDPNQPRKYIPTDKLQELADGMARIGQLTPIIVTADGRVEIDGKQKQRYMIIAGERRYRAARLLGWTEINAVTRDPKLNDKAEVQLQENVQRQQLTPMEEAAAFYEYMIANNCSELVLAKALGLDVDGVKARVRLLGLIPEAQAMVDSGELKITMAEIMTSAPDVVDEKLQKKLLTSVTSQTRLPTVQQFANYFERLTGHKTEAAQEAELQEIVKEGRVGGALHGGPEAAKKVAIPKTASKLPLPTWEKKDTVSRIIANYIAKLIEQNHLEAAAGVATLYRELIHGNKMMLPAPNGKKAADAPKEAAKVAKKPKKLGKPATTIADAPVNDAPPIMAAELVSEV